MSPIIKKKRMPLTQSVVSPSTFLYKNQKSDPYDTAAGDLKRVCVGTTLAALVHLRACTSRRFLPASVYFRNRVSDVASMSACKSVCMCVL